MIRPLFLPLLLLIFEIASGPASGQRILVQSTTSTDNSGFYEYILPFFEAETRLRVDVVAVGTGQAIRNAENGDADVLLVHAKAAEEAFVAKGYGLKRHDLMYNDFVIIGPADDPIHLAGAKGLKAVVRALGTGQADFVSRGDDSGTHKKERALWAWAGQAVPSGKAWYRETGSGMGATLRMAVECGCYTLSDRATWIAFSHKRGHRVLFEGDAELFNQYGIIAVNPARYPHVNAEGARRFIDWMLSPRGQALIAAFRLGGKQLFFPNAAR